MIKKKEIKQKIEIAHKIIRVRESTVKRLKEIPYGKLSYDEIINALIDELEKAEKTIEVYERWKEKQQSI